MSWSLGEAMSLFKGVTDDLKKLATSVCFPLCWIIRKMIRAKVNMTFPILEYSTPCPKLKPKFEFQNSLAQNSPAGTSELIPFGANLDLRCNCPSGTLEWLPFGANSYLPWDWRFLDILLGYSSLLFPVGVYYDSSFVRNYIFPRCCFIMILLSCGTTSITKSTRCPTLPSI